MNAISVNSIAYTSTNPLIKYYRDIETSDRSITAELNTEMETKYQDFLKTLHVAKRFFLNLGLCRSSVHGAFFHARRTQVIKDFRKIEALEVPINLDEVTEMETKYESYRKTHNFVVRFLMNLCWWRSSVHGAFLHARWSHEQKTAATADIATIWGIVISKDILKSKLHRSFYNGVYRRAFSTLNSENKKNSKDPKGLIWKVENSEKVQSYLIGTIHFNKKYFINAKGVQEAIKESDAFFTEIKSFDLFTFHLFDQYVISRVWERKKYPEALDSNKLRIETKRKEAEFKKNSEAKPKISELDLKVRRIIEETERFYKEGWCINTIGKRVKSKMKIMQRFRLVKYINMWQKGEIDKFKHEIASISNAGYYSCDARTEAWLKESRQVDTAGKPLPGLIDRIKNAKKPICIAVGTAHCIGIRVSLVEEFQKASFKVTRYE